MNQSPPSFAATAQALTGTTEGVLMGTRIATLDGLLPVEFLAPGDRIITRSGSVRLVSLSSLLRKDVEVVIISASAIGHDRPEVDLFVAPEQRLMIRDWRAKVLFGTATAAIPARQLVDGDFVRLATLPQARLFTLRFDAQHVIYAEGLELACPSTTVAAE